jgi:hypothetical protein
MTKLVLVCGPFGSGTTAVAGLLAGLGLPGIEPYFVSNDERTPNTFESVEFRDTLQRIVLEPTLSFNPNIERVAEIERLRDVVVARGHRTIFLKHALAALLIPDLGSVFDLRLVYVLRPLADIEATRRRRNWQPHTGAAGAQVIYSRMFETLINQSFPTMVLRYPQVVADPIAATQTLARFAGLEAPAETINRAAAFVRVPAAASN